MAAQGSKSRGKLWTVLILLVVMVTVVGVVWYKFFRQVPQWDEEPTPQELFKYGSIGIEEQLGIPYWIWLVLPRMFPEYLPGPGGYASLGIPWEEGRPMPVGFTRRTIGYERVGFNCAFCHTATVRSSADEVPTIHLGGPSHTFDVLAYQRFLQDCAADPRFNARQILAQVASVYDLPFLDRLVYRFFLIPGTRRTLLRQQQAFAWTETRPDWGRGRIDPFNPVKQRILGLDVGDTIGNADMVPVWNLRARDGMAYHWDGLNPDLVEVFHSSAIGDGATYKTLPVADLKRLEEWLLDLAPPSYPYDIDAELAAGGAALYQSHCASCHALGGEKTGQVLEWSEVQTDRHRIDMWTQEAADAYNAYGQEHGLGFEHFQAPDGYVNVPLDGLWLRAPYLHNGSVPTLTHLLAPPEERPTSFFRGWDVYDPQLVGFVSEGPEAERFGTPYDTTDPGNGNQGHLWGTDLEPEEKTALVEYLKTL